MEYSNILKSPSNTIAADKINTLTTWRQLKNNVVLIERVVKSCVFQTQCLRAADNFAISDKYHLRNYSKFNGNSTKNDPDNKLNTRTEAEAKLSFSDIAYNRWQTII